MSLNLFPSRVPIGRVIDSTGKELNVLMTVEFSRALADLLQRVGGTDGIGSDDIFNFAANLAVMESFDAVPPKSIPENHVNQEISGSNVARLRAEVAELRLELAMIRPAANLSRQLEDLRLLLEMQKPLARPVKRAVTGSRAGNAALASALSALAASGLIIDNTTV